MSLEPGLDELGSECKLCTGLLPLVEWRFGKFE